MAGYFEGASFERSIFLPGSTEWRAGPLGVQALEKLTQSRRLLGIAEQPSVLIHGIVLAIPRCTATTPTRHGRAHDIF